MYVVVAFHAGTPVQSTAKLGIATRERHSTLA
jgi:hypothetical protein